jgi:hypothetical protein
MSFDLWMLKSKVQQDCEKAAEARQRDYQRRIDRLQRKIDKRMRRDGRNTVRMMRRIVRAKISFIQLTKGKIHGQEHLYFPIGNVWFFSENGNLMACIWRTGEFAGGSDTIYVRNLCDLAPYLKD